LNAHDPDGRALSQRSCRAWARCLLGRECHGRQARCGQTHYVIRMTGVSVGQIVLVCRLDARRYTASGYRQGSGVLSWLVNGEGSVVAQAAS